MRTWKRHRTTLLAGSALAVVGMGCVAAPLTEELMFRGMPLPFAALGLGHRAQPAAQHVTTGRVAPINVAAAPGDHQSELAP